MHFLYFVAKLLKIISSAGCLNFLIIHPLLKLKTQCVTFSVLKVPSGILMTKSLNLLTSIQIVYLTEAFIIVLDAFFETSFSSLFDFRHICLGSPPIFHSYVSDY